MSQTATKERNVRVPPFAAPHVYVVAVVDGESPNAAYRIDRPNNVLGRGARADIRIEDPEISKNHCELVVDGPTCTIRDLDSRNGTVINGRRLRSELVQRLRHLDEIEIGSTRLLFLSGRFRVRAET